MAITAASLLVKIQGDSSGAQSAIKGVLGGLSGLSAGAVIGAAAVVGAVAGIGIASTKMAADYQAGMESLVTGAGESQKNLQLVSNGILDLAAKTGTSTQQLTDGMYMIESAGHHGADGLNILKAAAEGARVGNADLGTVADATTTILADYPNVLHGASGAVNTLIATVANGKTHMSDLATSLAQILPTASSAKVGLNDIMGAMATLTGEGVPAANAATYLRQTILALDAPSKQAKTALADVGLSTSQVAAEMKKSLPDTIQMITDAVGKKFPVGSAGYVNALKDIMGGSKQLQGVLDLSGQHLATFKDNVGNVSGAVSKGGTSIQGWSTIQGEFNTKMDRLNQVVQTSMIQLGQHLLPVATQVAGEFADHLPGAIRAVTGAFTTAINIGQGLIRFFQDTGPAATGVKIVLGVLGGAMLGFAASAVPSAVAAVMASVTAFGAQTVAAGAAAIATMAAAAPFILIGAAIAGVVAIVILAVTHWKQITTALGNFKDMAGNVLGRVGDLKDEAVKLIQLALQPLKTDVDLARMAFDDIRSLIGRFVQFELAGLRTDLGLAQNAFNGLKSLIGGLVSRELTGLKVIIGDIKGFFDNLLGSIGKVVGGIGNLASSIKNMPGVGGLLGSLPHFAAGGTMPSDGLALVGEKGPEIVQLPGGSKVMPNGSVPSLGSNVSTGGGSSQPNVTLQIDGKTFGRLIMPYITEQLVRGAGLRVA